MEYKKDYLVKTLSRTKRKDYENYVINRLYNRLNDLDIKPMTQKYIKRNLKSAPLLTHIAKLLSLLVKWNFYSSQHH